jgi:hypothetical protein
VAVDAGNVKAAQAAYASFLAVADVQKPYTGTTKEFTQGYSTEYDWKYKTDKGTIYVR